MDFFFLFKSGFLKIILNFFYIYLLLKKLVNEKYFSVKENLVWFSEKYFPFILGGRNFPKILKNLEMSYYLLIISTLILKLLIIIIYIYIIYIYIYIILNIYFSISFFRI
jgi:hypothetical protein